MEVWQLWGVLGIILVILEMFTPALFFLNLALAAILVGAVTYFYPVLFVTQCVAFVVASALLVLFLRPILLRVKDEPEKTGVKAIYYGQSAKVTEKITANSGRISIFGEAWEARTKSGAEVDVDKNVKILYCEKLTMIVEEI